MKKMREFQSGDKIWTSDDHAVKAALRDFRPLHFEQRQEAALHETFSVTVKAGYTFPGFNQGLKIPSGLALPPTPDDPFGAFEGWYIRGTEGATRMHDLHGVDWQFYDNVHTIETVKTALEMETGGSVTTVEFIVSPEPRPSLAIGPEGNVIASTILPSTTHPSPTSTTSSTASSRTSNDAASNSESTTGAAAGNSNVAAGDRLKLNPIAQARRMCKLSQDPIVEGMSPDVAEQYRKFGTSGAVAKLYQEFGNVLAMSTDPKRGGWSDKNFVDFRRELNKGPEFLVKMLTEEPPAGCAFDCARRVNARIVASQHRLDAKNAALTDGSAVAATSALSGSSARLDPKKQAANMCKLAVKPGTTWDHILAEYAKVLTMEDEWAPVDWIIFHEEICKG